MYISGLKSTVLKLSLILFAFGVCPKTEGLSDKERTAFSRLNKVYTIIFTDTLQCPPSVSEIATACTYADAPKAASEESTEVEIICKAALKYTARCMEYSFENCGVDPNQRAKYTNSFNKLSMEACSPSPMESSSESHHMIPSFLYFVVLALAINIVFKFV